MVQQLAGGDAIDNKIVSSKRIHVIHIIDKLSVGGSHVHGIGKAIEWWIPRFDPEVFSFSVISLRGIEPFGEVFEKQGTRIDFLDKGKFDITTLSAMVRLIREQKASVLHLHGFGASNFGRLASRITGVPNIVHEHCVFDDQPFYQTVADKLLAPFTDTSIAVSKRVARYMVERRSIRESTLHTFFMGLPLADFTTPATQAVEQFRESISLPDGQRLVGSIGRLDTQKGLIYLLQAARRIDREKTKVTFLIVGDGPLRGELESFVRANDLQNDVIFTGYRTDVAVVMAACDVIAIPSLWEGGPITLFEAMCLGKPVVGTPVGLIDEVLENGESGFVVPCEDDVALAEKLQLLLSNDELAKRIGTKAKVAVQAHDISMSVKLLTGIYSDMMTKAR